MARDPDALVAAPAVLADCAEYPSLIAVVRQARTEELKVWQSLANLATEALNPPDNADATTFAFLQPFLLEQSAAVAQLDTVLVMLAEAGENPAALRQVDQYLGGLAP